MVKKYQLYFFEFFESFGQKMYYKNLSKSNFHHRNPNFHYEQIAGLSNRASAATKRLESSKFVLKSVINILVSSLDFQWFFFDCKRLISLRLTGDWRDAAKPWQMDKKS